MSFSIGDIVRHKMSGCIVRVVDGVPYGEDCFCGVKIENSTFWNDGSELYEGYDDFITENFYLVKK